MLANQVIPFHYSYTKTVVSHCPFALTIRPAGLATYVTNLALPIVAEVALLVADVYQGHGIGRKLMNCLVEEA